MNISNFVKVTYLSLICLSILLAARSRKGEVEIGEGINSALNANQGFVVDTNQHTKETEQSASPYDSLVIARYLGSTVVRKTNYVEDVMKANDLSKAIGGRVYSFEIRKSICGKLSSNSAFASSKGTHLSFFNEQGSGFYQPYEVQKDYLIYLSAIPDQKKLKKDFELDKKTTYYNPYPFDGDKRTKERVREVLGEPEEKDLERLKEQCREHRYE